MVAGEKCYRLLPIVPVLLTFFRQSSEVVADDMVLVTKEDEEATDKLLKALYTAVHTEKRLSLTQVRFVCENSSVPERTWPKAITKIVTTCAPRLIKDKLCERLFKEYSSHKQIVINSNQECGSILGPVLDDLPRNNFEILGAICAYIRDYSQDVNIVCRSLGRVFLTSGGSGKAAKELFALIVENAEAIFGRVAATRTITVTH